MSKHTKGPWVVAFGDSTSLFIKSGNYIVARAYLGMPEPEASANANLIAAAPEMLEALELILRDLQALQHRGIEINGVGATAIARLIKQVKAFP